MMLEVSDYMLIGDSKYPSSHAFLISFRFPDQSQYAVQRSLHNITTFHKRIAKKFPHSRLPPLPESLQLDLVTVNLEKKLKSDVNQTRNDLTTYFNNLLTLPEILVSEDLAIFLDAESGNGENFELYKETSPVDVLLVGEDVEVKTVSRDLKVEIKMDKDQMLIWSFFTISKDIGFSISLLNRVILPYQRYNSHKQNISGTLESPLDCSGKLTLIWDNSYSKMRTKRLNYITKVVSKNEFEFAKNMAMELTKSRLIFEQRRILLRKVLRDASRNVIGTESCMNLNLSADSYLRSSSMSTSFDAAVVLDMDAQLQFLKTENSQLRASVIRIESDLVEERLANAMLIAQVENLTESQIIIHELLGMQREEMEMEALNHLIEKENWLDSNAEQEKKDSSFSLQNQAHIDEVLALMSHAKDEAYRAYLCGLRVDQLSNELALVKQSFVSLQQRYIRQQKRKTLLGDCVKQLRSQLQNCICEHRVVEDTGIVTKDPKILKAREAGAAVATGADSGSSRSREAVGSTGRTRALTMPQSLSASSSAPTTSPLSSQVHSPGQSLGPPTDSRSQARARSRTRTPVEDLLLNVHCLDPDVHFDLAPDSDSLSNRRAFGYAIDFDSESEADGTVDLPNEDAMSNMAGVRDMSNSMAALSPKNINCPPSATTEIADNDGRKSATKSPSKLKRIGRKLWDLVPERKTLF